MTAVQIVPFRPEHREAFRALNLAWIEEFFSVEPRDRDELDRPEATILAPGGAILMAEMEDTVVGTCALLRADADRFDLAKMAVAAPARRRGVGRALVLAAIAHARTASAARIDLLTHPRLPDAVRLYCALGFTEIPVPPVNYSRVGLAMTLDLRA